MIAMMALPTFAQENPVVINGSIIDWYYYGKDYTGGTSGEGWNQQPAGGGAWIEWFDDGTYVTHPTGAANLGLLSLTLNPGQPKPLLPLFLIRNTVLYSNCGGLYMGGNEYYSFFGHEAGFGDNMEGEYGSESYEILVRKWTWEGENPDGSYSNVKYQQVGKLYNQPTDLTYDPVNDIVYGVFNIGGGDGYKLGTLDMETFKITWISREAMPLTGELRTIAINSKGELYGTDKSGNFYRVSTEDGTLTLIGNLGFKSQQRMMSATFDYRTDKLYWLGYMNNGKNSASTDGTNTTLTVAQGGRDTGLYEINVETGEATLIGKTDFIDVELIYDDNGAVVDAKTNKYGKMQLTGIYVEGSIQKNNYDLLASFTTWPQQMTVGQDDTDNVVVKVKNIGTNNVRGSKYSVSLYDGHQLVGTIDNDGEEQYTHDLDAGKSYTYTFSYPAPATTGDHKLRVEVSYAADERTENNTAEAIVRAISNQVDSGITLNGKIKGNALILSWNEPDGHIVENVETYVPFSYDNLGAWIMYDGDKGYTQKANNWNSSINYSNWSTPKAYIVMDPQKAGFDLAVGGEKFNAYSGKQYFAAWWTAMPDDSEAGGSQVPNDDWMISPRLNGQAQTISFWAKGYKGAESPGYVTEMNFVEQMRVLATEAEYKSADDMNIADWTIVRDTFVVDNTAWTQYTADIPAGVRHFALQCCSQEGFVLMIDDIEFNVGGNITAYRIYYNGKMLEEVSAGTTTYTPEKVMNGDTFYVTAVFEDGTESSPSNVYTVGGTQGIEFANTVNTQKAAVIFDIRGRQVNNMNRPGIYIIKTANGRSQKVVVK